MPAPSTGICTLSLHDALPISVGDGLGDAVHLQLALPRFERAEERGGEDVVQVVGDAGDGRAELADVAGDRKSTRLNSSHGYISYAVFCLKKKKKQLFMRSV